MVLPPLLPSGCAAAVMQEFMDLLESPTFKSYGSSLKLLMVAEGEAHVYPRYRGDTLKPEHGLCVA